MFQESRKQLGFAVSACFIKDIFEMVIDRAGADIQMRGNVLKMNDFVRDAHDDLGFSP
ncbi:MAG: hypothetical protein P4M08_03055 [Oligoflexia bacterium]|nr:hypothetical protein [Oligoflexia bacterium]